MENEQHGLEVSQNDFIKMMPVSQAIENYNQFQTFVKDLLKPDLDYGVIPGTGKPSLYKPGAEKLRFVYAIGVEFEATESVVDYERLIVDYSYRCTARSKTGQILAQCEGNCNSMEAKFGYVWKLESDLPEGINKSKLLTKVGSKESELDFAIQKAETGGQYGKPAEYWKKWKDAIASGAAKHITRTSRGGKVMDAWELGDAQTVYRCPDPDIMGKKNTIMKMAQKRAFVGAILIATGASEYFTQDIEDMDLKGDGMIYSDHHATPDSKPDYKKASVSDLPFEDVKHDEVPGHWYAKLEKCKTWAAVDKLALQHKETIQAQPSLRKAFIDYKNSLPKPKADPKQDSPTS
jgi:hypothetical protein